MRISLFLAPADVFAGGDAATADLNDRARDGRPLDSLVIVESDDSTPAEQHLAVCGVALLISMRR